MIEDIIRIAREKPDAEARALIAKLIARPRIGWMTADGKRIPIYAGEASDA